MEWSGVEWSGVEWSGVEWSGLSDDHHRSIGMNINVVVYLSAPFI